MSYPYWKCLRVPIQLFDINFVNISGIRIVKGQLILKAIYGLLSFPKKQMKCTQDTARTYLQLPLRQWGAGNVYLFVLSSWKVNIAENPIAVMGL